MPLHQNSRLSVIGIWVSVMIICLGTQIPERDMVQQCGVAYLCTRALASLTLNSILACQPPAQSAPILAAKWQDDHDNGDDKCDANNDDNGDSNDDNDYGNDDEARQRCKLFLCKLFPSRHWLLS